ncbi:MAG: hypothetical protein Q8P29_02470 [Candidatus Levybacteria bacterium]|nr:hypothetical protein [Candidatus Levybacteria bacterium]MDZ4227849.1 hypothetical protein [Candidatus Levybacteria bacterium]
MQRLERLPQPQDKAYFLNISSENKFLQNEVLKRAGDNLVYAMQYGSFVTGDATPTSMIDMILIVENTREFHERNKAVAASDYGIPRSPAFHNWLNRFGFNFYHSQIQTENGPIKTKYAVISRENFIKGCNGTLQEKEREKIGAFGFYVAGRMQKAALKPFLKTTDEQKITEIEKAINSARIDGIWLALGLVPKEFSLDDLVKKYVSLSYMADLRVERAGKIQTMIDKNRQDYLNMLLPILSSFVRIGLVKPSDNGKWTKLNSPSEAEVKKRLLSIKGKTAVVNFLKNPITIGIDKAASYALQKVQRSIKSRKE